DLTAEEADKKALDPLEIDRSRHFSDRFRLCLTHLEVLIPHLIDEHLSDSDEGRADRARLMEHVLRDRRAVGKQGAYGLQVAFAERFFSGDGLGESEREPKLLHLVRMKPGACREIFMVVPLLAGQQEPLRDESQERAARLRGLDLFR